MNDYSISDILFVIAVAWFVSLMNVIVFAALAMSGRSREVEERLKREREEK